MAKLNVFEINDYLNKKKLPQFILFRGEDSYSHNFGIKEVFSALNITLPEVNLNIFESRPDPKELKNAMETLPFMSDKRAVWVQKAEIFNASYNILTENGFPDTNYLIISSYGTISTKNELYSFINKNGIIFDCGVPNEYQAVKLIIKTAEENGLSITGNTAKHLYEMCAGDMEIIGSELNKLINVCTGIIDKKDILKYVTPSLEQSVFKIHDYLCNGKYAEAALFLENVENDEEILGILGLLGGNLRRMLIARACMDSGMKAESAKNHIVSETGSSSWAAQQAVLNCTKLKKESLRYGLKKLSEIDYKIKHGFPVDVKASLIEIYSNK